jgi:hypothetical protein
MIRKKIRKRGPVQAKKIIYDGIKFASGLEKYMYIALKKAKIRFKYEGETFVLLNGFHFDNQVFERQSNSKGEFIIETKGRPNESFPIRWKLFKKLVVEQFPNYTLYKPQNQKECDKTIDLILGMQKK